MAISSQLIVSKLDAAKRQLDTALRLYFHDDDPVSIHTLASASFNLLSDIAKGSSIEAPNFRQQVIDSVPDDLKKIYNFHSRKHQNVFKHANRDHEANISFNPEASDWIFIDAIQIYRKITTENPPLYQLFDVWFQYHHRHLLLPEHQHQREQFDAHAHHFRDRMSYFNEMLPMFSRMTS
jgi:hypothetical protein